MILEDKINEKVAIVEKTIVEFNDFKRVLSDLIEEFSNPSREAIATLENRLNFIHSNLCLTIPFFFKLRTLHDDKRCTAKKAEISFEIRKTEKSFTKAESLASASKEYKDFLDDRAAYYEFYETVTQLDSSMQNYLTAIAHRFKIREQAFEIDK